MCVFSIRLELSGVPDNPRLHLPRIMTPYVLLQFSFLPQTKLVQLTECPNPPHNVYLEHSFSESRNLIGQSSGTAYIRTPCRATTCYRS